MKVKAVSLILLVIFATIASFVVLSSSSPIVEENINSTESNSIVQIDEVGDELQGKEIDNPGMPG